MIPFINIVPVLMMHSEYKLDSVKEKLVNLRYYRLLFDSAYLQIIDLLLSRYYLILQLLILYKNRESFLCEYFIDIDAPLFEKVDGILK